MGRIYSTFLSQDPERCDPQRSKVVLVPVPYDATVSAGTGCRRGPAAILEASNQLEEYDIELDLEPISCGIHTDAAIEPDLSSDHATVDLVEQVCRSWHDLDRFVIVLGGEHTVAIGGARAAAAHHGEVSILQIDAHLDLRDSYQGSRYSHACTARRLWETGKVVPVGIRNCSLPERQWIRDRDVEVFWAQDVADRQDDAWMERVVDSLGPKVYVTLDLDGLDSSIVPATGTPEPGGLGYWQTLGLLKRVADARHVVGADICELAPSPGQHASDYVAASPLYKMVGYFVASRS